MQRDDPMYWSEKFRCDVFPSSPPTHVPLRFLPTEIRHGNCTVNYGPWRLASVAKFVCNHRHSLSICVCATVGKTYTLCGSGPAGGEEEGILARSMTRLFSGLKKTRGRHLSVRVSLLRIYCETLQVESSLRKKRKLCVPSRVLQAVSRYFGSVFARTQKPLSTVGSYCVVVSPSTSLTAARAQDLTLCKTFSLNCRTCWTDPPRGTS